MKKTLSLFMALAMLLVPVSAPGPSVLGESEPPEVIGEILAMRENDSETYALSDGSYECVVYAADKYYDAGGAVPELIDNSVVEKRFAYGGKEYAYTNAANSTRYHFAAEAPEILISYKTKYLSFSVAGTSPTNAVPGGSRENKRVGDLNLSGDNYIAYEGAFPGVELIYAAKNGVLKEYIVLESPEAPLSFTFLYDTGEQTAGYTEDGRIAFFDSNGEPSFELTNLFAIDSAEAYTEELTYAIGEPGNGKTPVTVTLSEEYAHDPERVWPIVIDPSTSISGSSITKDSFVSSKNTIANYYLDDYLRFGYTNTYHTSRSYIKFDIPATIPSTATINSAYMSLKKSGSGNEPSLKAYRVTAWWASSTVNWENMPGYTNTNVSNTAIEETNNWYRFYVTAIVKSWHNGTYTNYGFLVKRTPENGTGYWSTFYSSDADSGKAPQLRITYNVMSGARPYDEAESGIYANCMGYALNKVDYIGPSDIGLEESLDGLSGTTLYNTARDIIKQWMTNNGVIYQELDHYYDSLPSVQYYRVVYRANFKNNNSDPAFNYNNSLPLAQRDEFVFHWYYQTSSANNCNWAHKPGDGASELISNSAQWSPIDLNWNSNGDGVDYISTPVYFAIKYTGSQNWVDNNTSY